ncbi:MAG: LPS export ABC transporter permease LptG [Syntrophales bacterium]|jgi:lipopolysaccharide export system permease protein|nr:LPS export ABC transporter permease LptG [Syntrophales bacterium]MDY0045129.1 LPS export ABC transporter permease LptG [Syntrophales bacterium]
MMSVIDRYILKEFLRTFCLIIISLAALYLIVDFFERIRMFVSNKATFSQIAAYFIFSIPTIVTQMIPISVLLSSLVTFGILSKNSELTALKANGISLYRSSLSIIAASVGIAFFSFLVSELATPHSNQKVKHIKLIEIQKRQQLGTFTQNEIWYRGKKAIYNIAVFDPVRGILRGIRISYLDHDMNLVKRIDAKEAYWKNGKWIFHNLLITTFPEDGFPLINKITSSVIDIPEKPADFLIVQKDTDEMGFGELKEYIAKLQAEGYDATRYLTDLHGKIAFPLVSVFLAVLGLCFSCRSERSGGIAQSIGIGVIIGLSYWIVFAFSISLGRSGALSPFFSAWAANIIFGLLSIGMLMRIRT